MTPVEDSLNKINDWFFFFFFKCLEVSMQCDDIQSVEGVKTVNPEFFMKKNYPSEIKVIWKQTI